MSDQSLVLIDMPTGESTDVAFLEHLGHSAMVCHGPEPKTLCPLLSGEGCPMVDETHGVLFMLDLDRPQHRAILRRYQEVLREDVPIRVRATAEQAEAHADLLRGVHVFEEAVDLDGFAAEVEASENIGD
jgi:hypothetical protein